MSLQMSYLLLINFFGCLECRQSKQMSSIKDSSKIMKNWVSNFILSWGFSNASLKTLLYLQYSVCKVRSMCSSKCWLVFFGLGILVLLVLWLATMAQASCPGYTSVTCGPCYKFPCGLQPPEPLPLCQACEELRNPTG